MEFFLSSSLILLIKILVTFYKAEATTFVFVNQCGDRVWPAILSNAGSPELIPTGFDLSPGASRSFLAPSGWSGRFWGRTGCSGTSSNTFLCATGDCGTGKIECSGAGAAPPATLAEFTLSSASSNKDFYDVSLVDGYNLPMVVSPSGACASAGCAVDLNQRCPAELRFGSGSVAACRSACDAFDKPEYCCSGAYANPTTCRPTAYSQLFKNACPRAYSYAFDDPTSTFTCGGGADYTITFCPNYITSTRKPSPDSSTSSTTTSPTPRTTTTVTGTSTTTGGVMLEDDSWLASLATGDANSITLSAQNFFKVAAIATCYCLIWFI